VCYPLKDEVCSALLSELLPRRPGAGRLLLFALTRNGRNIAAPLPGASSTN
jgi:hypothetical protein